MANILETARDLGQGIYTKAEVDDSLTDIQESSLSKVASNVLLSGNLALASSAVTKSNANITYTGNGTSQDITTGIGSVDFTVASNGSGYYHDRVAGDCIVKNDAGTIIESGSCVVNTSKVHIKARSASSNNLIEDGIRGSGNRIFTNLVNAEDTGDIVDFNSIGFSLDNFGTSNTNLATYIAHQTLYTHIKWGLTNQGKRYITAYNPVTREVMTMYQGSGIAGHQIPNALGIKLDYIDVKNLSAGSNWASETNDFKSAINTTYYEGQTSGRIETFADAYTELKYSNEVENNVPNNTYISYGFANSETKIITQYQGTGASGNFVETLDVNGVGKKPRRVIIKRTNDVGNWIVHDTKRNVSGDSKFYLNTSDIETTDEKIDIEINGVTLTSTWSYENASGGQYIAIVEFDTTNSTDDTYFDYPTDDTNLNVTAGKLPYTDGRDTTNGAYNVFTQSYTGSVDFSTCPDGIHYVALDSNNAPKFYEKVAIGSYEKEAADDNRLVFNTDDGKWYTTTGGELVTNGTFDTDVSGWTAENGATVSLVSSTIKVLSPSGSAAYASFVLPSLVVGETYKVDFSIVAYGGAAGRNRSIQLRGVDGTYYGTLVSSTSIGSLSTSFTAQDSELEIWLSVDAISSGDYSQFDNISVYKKDATLDTALTTPISFIDDKPYQVQSQTPMDRLVDYPSIPKNVMESSYVDGDLEVSGEVKGKNQCTAWVNFDGTTTPPTIKDSYNVKDVVKLASGEYKIYFSSTMDNLNYSASVTPSSNSGYYYDGLALGCIGSNYGTPDITTSYVGVMVGLGANGSGSDGASKSVLVQIFGGK